MEDEKPFDFLRILFEGIIAGGTAGVVVETALYPIDTIKTRLQAGALTGAITTPLDVIKTRLMVQGSANQYRGIFDCVQTTIREEGPPALLKGTQPRVLRIGIDGSIFFFFGVLKSTKRLLAERRPKPSL
ncbi:hypothetical protein V6N13_044546 [Hibiscus sabdariffa]